MLPRVLLATLLAATVLAAGCVKNEPPAPSNDGSNAPPSDAPPANPPPPVAPAQPQPFALQDKGSIQGVFEKTWAIHASSISPREFSVKFDLAGAQPGTPPTALVTLVLSDPDGKPVKTETIGVGQAKNGIAWSLAGGDITKAGDYKLKATAEAAPGTEGIPSAGLAEWTLAIAVNY